MTPLRVVLVEDSGAYAELVRIALRNKACEFSHIESAEEAIEMLARGFPEFSEPLPNLMLLDVNLPGMTGIELARRVKSDAALRTMPIVMLTTSQSGRDIEESYAAFANSYVVKPDSFPELRDLLDDIFHYWTSVNVAV